jgi:hypothetical protein
MTTSSDIAGGCLFSRKNLQREYMKFPDRRSCWYLLSGFAVACSGGARNSPPGVPSPLPTSPVAQAPASVAPTVEVSSFKYASGAVRYRISRSAAIENTGPDLQTHREISTNITNEVLTLDPRDQTTNFTALIDTSATTTQGLIGSAQSVTLPIQLSGSLTSGTLIINAEPAHRNCDAVTSMLMTDLHNLLIAFPERLSTGVNWTDSADVQGCQAGIPTSAHSTRSYIVSGSASYEGRPVLVILRTDTTRAKGEGGLQQHRVSIDAAGTGTAIYYLDTATGQVVRLAVDQTLDLGITASATRSQFRQNSKQEFQIVP